MFQRFHEKRDEGGFTLIELLVVILIVAILAAVAIPVFLRQREKGYRDQMQSSLKNAATAQESYATANNGAYTSTLSDLESEGFNVTADVTLTLGGTSDEPTGYCMEATHTGLPGETWSYDSADGEPLEQTC
ncbi:MAG: type IV pilin protein [Acidimicrobiia bacterium]